MATKSSLWDQLKKEVKIFDETYRFFGGAETTTPNLLANIISLEEDYGGNHIGDTTAQMKAFRSKASSMITSATAVATPLIRELARIGYYSYSTNINDVIDDIYDGMVAASETVRNRDFTFGAVSAYVSNVGSGTVYRVTKDASAYDIENGADSGGVTKILCNADRYSGRARGNESFTIEGVGLSDVDSIELGTAPQGSGVLYALTSRSCTAYITDGSFDTLDSASTLTANGWAFDVPANFSKETAITYRDTLGSTTGVSLGLGANGYFSQNLADEGKRFDTTKPTVVVLRYYRDGADGALTLELGNQSVSVADLTAVADTTWTDLVLGTTSSEGWYKNWGEDDATLKITLASNTTGDIYFDEILVYQPSLYDGKYYMVTAGPADFLIGDYFTFTDTVSNEGRIQYIFNKLFGRYLPHAAAGETYADPT
jgi:hypothetical protein